MQYSIIETPMIRFYAYDAAGQVWWLVEQVAQWYPEVIDKVFDDLRVMTCAPNYWRCVVFAAVRGDTVLMISNTLTEDGIPLMDALRAYIATEGQ